MIPISLGTNDSLFKIFYSTLLFSSLRLSAPKDPFQSLKYISQKSDVWKNQDP